MSLLLFSESVELPESLEKEKDIDTRLTTRLREKGFDFSIEDGVITYKDFFNEADVSTKQSGNRRETTYSISIAAKCITVIVLTLLLLLPAGLILALVWYMNYSRLKRTIKSVVEDPL